MSLAAVHRTRQNHAIEHATITVLLERGARTPLAGYGTPGGFFVHGKLSADDVRSAATEALTRLQAGQRELAVTPHCGTNLAVGAMLAALMTGIIMSRFKRRMARAPLTAVAIIASTMLRRPLGNLVQRRYTTLAEVADVRITGVSSLKLGKYALYRVRTRRDAAREAALAPRAQSGAL